MKERIFISYKRVDKDRVFAIKDGIEQATRAKCWIDLDGIESNAQFVTKIVGAIDECDVFIFMRSKEHNKITNHDTDWTIREVNYALEEHKNIVIVNLDNTPMPKWFKFMFPNKQEIDATDPDKLNRLNDDLCRWLGTAEEPVPQPKEEEEPVPQPEEEEKPAPQPEEEEEPAPQPEEEEPAPQPEEEEKPAPQPEEEEPVHQQTDEELLKKVWQEMTDEEIIQIGKYIFQKDPKDIGVQLVKADRTICNAIIPNTIPYNDTELPVTSIKDFAFSFCHSLESITIPNSVTTIGCATFEECDSLTSITLPNGLKAIDILTFSRCSSLTSITIPNSVNYIYYKAFEKCKSLNTIQYEGTMQQWKDIYKHSWRKGVPAKVVHCTDGDVKLGLFS